MFIGGSGYGVFTAAAVDKSPIFHQLFSISLISALSSVLIISSGLPRDFDRLGGDGTTAGWAASDRGLLSCFADHSGGVAGV